MRDYKIAIIGLGYVGLPLAVEFAKKYPTIGFDINSKRINELISGNDSTLEVNSEELKSSLVENTNPPKSLKLFNFFFAINSRKKYTKIVNLVYFFSLFQI